MHGARRAGDARSARRRLRRRPQGLGPLARRARRHRARARASNAARPPAGRFARVRRPRDRLRLEVVAERQDPDLPGATDGEGRGAGRRAGDPAGRHARRPTSRATRRAARRRSSAATSRRPSRSSTALGTMKGAAMKVGQVMSFLDVGLVPEEYREEFQRKLGELRDAAPKVTFEQMRKVIEAGARRAARGRVRRVRRASRSPRPRSARSTGRGCTTGARSRSRSSIRASPRR